MEVSVDGMGWSRAVQVEQGDHHVVVPHKEEGGAAQVLRITVDQTGSGRFHVVFRSANAATPVRPLAPPPVRLVTPWVLTK